MHPVDEYELVSFQLTDDYFAWYVGDHGELLCNKVNAIGLAKFWVVWFEEAREIERELMHVGLCGVTIGDHGDTEIVNLCDNFVTLLKAGEFPSAEAIAYFRRKLFKSPSSR